MTDRLFKCHATFDGKARCTFEGDNEAAGAHWREVGHARCVVCSLFLGDDERQTCLKCVTNARFDLTEIVETVTLAPEVIEAGGYRGILIDLLAYTSDGAIESPRQQAEPELYADAEWTNDPWPVIAVLESIERTWRLEFGHGPAVTLATVTSCASYLDQWLTLAARTFPGFDDDAATLRTLASRLRHATGTSDDPQAGVRCLDCDDTRLERTYRPPVMAVPDPRRSEDGRRGMETEGKTDTYACPTCRREYGWADYGKAVHHYAASIEGWVRIADGAAAVRREPALIWRWIRDGKLAAACLLGDPRARILLADLRALDELTPRRRDMMSGSLLAAG